jgi:hypothetical protein
MMERGKMMWCGARGGLRAGGLNMQAKSRWGEYVTFAAILVLFIVAGILVWGLVFFHAK